MYNIPNLINSIFNYSLISLFIIYTLIYSNLDAKNKVLRDYTSIIDNETDIINSNKYNLTFYAMLHKL